MSARPTTLHIYSRYYYAFLEFKSTLIGSSSFFFSRLIHSRAGFRAFEALCRLLPHTTLSHRDVFHARFLCSPCCLLNYRYKWNFARLRLPTEERVCCRSSCFVHTRLMKLHFTPLTYQQCLWAASLFAIVKALISSSNHSTRSTTATMSDRIVGASFCARRLICSKATLGCLSVESKYETVELLILAAMTRLIVLNEIKWCAADSI